MKLNRLFSFSHLLRTTALVGLPILFSACSRDAGTTTTAAPNDSPGSETATVAVSKAVRERLSKSVTLTAEFVPWQNVEIHAKVSGYVKQMNVDIGDRVKAGDVLATLEIPEIDQQLNQAKAAVETAEAQATSMEAEYHETTLVAQRMAAAAKESEGLIAQQDIDTANDKNRANEANLTAARQKVVEAQADEARLEAMVSYSTIVAPFDGVVTRRYADTGALVQAGTVQSGTGGQSNSMPLVSFAELKTLRLEFPVPESDVAFVHVGDPVQIEVASLGRKFQGKIARCARQVDLATRTMLTEVDVDNSDYSYTPGMYATVELALAQQEDALTIPIQSLSGGDKPTVMVVADNKLENRSVTLGIETPERAQVVFGLKDDDLVVVGNHSAFQPGETVRPKLVENTP